MKEKLKVFSIIFISLVLLSVIIELDLDQVWAYGFSYNISRGLLPYRDYNMIIGPLYSLLMSIPMKLFGNYLI